MLVTDFLEGRYGWRSPSLHRIVASDDLTGRAAATFPLQLSRLAVSRACFVGGTIRSFSTTFRTYS